MTFIVLILEAQLMNMILFKPPETVYCHVINNNTYYYYYHNYHYVCYYLYRDNIPLHVRLVFKKIYNNLGSYIKPFVLQVTWTFQAQKNQREIRCRFQNVTGW